MCAVSTFGTSLVVTLRGKGNNILRSRANIYVGRRVFQSKVSTLIGGVRGQENGPVLGRRGRVVPTRVWNRSLKPHQRRNTGRKATGERAKKWLEPRSKTVADCVSLIACRSGGLKFKSQLRLQPTTIGFCKPRRCYSCDTQNRLSTSMLPNSNRSLIGVLLGRPRRQDVDRSVQEQDKRGNLRSRILSGFEIWRPIL